MADAAGPTPLLVVGRVARVHGLCGEVSVQLVSDDPDRLEPGRELRFEKPGAPARMLTVATRRFQPKRLLIRFEGVETREQAERLAGGDLSVPFDPSEVGPDEYYPHQLEGLEVRTVAGEVVGKILGVAFLPGRVFLEVEREGRTRLVPFHPDIVKGVDLAEGRVTIDPPEGLLEL